MNRKNEELKTIRDEFVVYDNRSHDEIFRGTYVECEQFIRKANANRKPFAAKQNPMMFVLHCSE